MVFAEKLRDIRYEYRYNRKEFARKLNINYCTYCSYESGSRKPTLKFLRSLMQFIEEENVVVKAIKARNLTIRDFLTLD